MGGYKFNPFTGKFDITGEDFPAGQGNILFVSTSGNDATAVKGNLAKPYLTPDAAVLDAVAGDTICFLAGSYTCDNALSKEGVKYTTIGQVTITKTTVNSIFIISAFVQNVFIDGDFIFHKTTNTGNVFECNGNANGIDVYLSFNEMLSTTNGAIFINNSSINLFGKGRLVKSTSTKNTISLNSAIGAFYCNFESTAWYGIESTKCNIFGNSKTSISTTYASRLTQCYQYGAATGGINLYYQSSFIGPTIKVLFTDNNNKAIVTGGLNTTVLNNGLLNVIDLSGIESSTITNNSAGAIVHVALNVIGASRATLINTAGTMKISNTLSNGVALTTAALTINGGKVILDDDIETPEQPIVVNGGTTLIVNKGIKSLGNTPQSHIITMTGVGGLVILNGAALVLTHAEALGIRCNDAQNVKVLGLRTNRDLFASKQKKVRITVGSAVDGATYSVTINATTYSYIAAAGNTVIDIAAGLVAAIAAAGITDTDNLDGTFDLLANVAGTDFSYSTLTDLGAIMTSAVLIDNHLAPTNSISNQASNYTFDADVEY